MRCNNGTGTVEAANITDVALTCVPPGSPIGEDDFNRPDAADLGGNWSPMDDGPLSISSGQFLGNPDALAGDIRDVPSETYASDQYSQIEVTANSIGQGVSSNGEWVGPTVRSQNDGQDTYLGIYFWTTAPRSCSSTCATRGPLQNVASPRARCPPAQF